VSIYNEHILHVFRSPDCECFGEVRKLIEWYEAHGAWALALHTMNKRHHASASVIENYESKYIGALTVLCNLLKVLVSCDEKEKKIYWHQLSCSIV
jgi:hypothetical protein